MPLWGSFRFLFTFNSLSQNRTLVEQERIIESLAMSRDSSDQQIAEYMKRQLKR